MKFIIFINVSGIIRTPPRAVINHSIRSESHTKVRPQLIFHYHHHHQPPGANKSTSNLLLYLTGSIGITYRVLVRNTERCP